QGAAHARIGQRVLAAVGQVRAAVEVVEIGAGPGGGDHVRAVLLHQVGRHGGGGGDVRQPVGQAVAVGQQFGLRRADDQLADGVIAHRPLVPVVGVLDHEHVALEAPAL